MPRILDITNEVCLLCERGFTEGQSCFVQEITITRLDSDGLVAVFLEDNASLYHKECMDIATGLSIFSIFKTVYGIASTHRGIHDTP